MGTAFSAAGIEGLRAVLSEHVASGEVPGLVALVARHGEVHVEALGLRRDAIVRIASMTKPIAAAAALILVDDGRLRLDEPVARCLPELAEPRVLRSPSAALDDTVPAPRAITLRDLLTFRLGTGLVLAPPDSLPIQRALAQAGFAPGPLPPSFTPDEYMKRLAALPLVHQPGEKWMYHTGADVLGVLIARAAGKPFDVFLRERLFEPLGMRDTDFHVPAEKLARLSNAYARNAATNALDVFDAARASRYARPPVFASGGAGLVSTADDYLAFSRMLLGKGRLGDTRVLSEASVEEMTRDQLSAQQRAEARPFFEDTRSWGLGLSVLIGPDGLARVPGRFGWDGGYGTSAYADPHLDLVAILMTQRLMESPEPPRVFRDFWKAAYESCA